MRIRRKLGTEFYHRALSTSRCCGLAIQTKGFAPRCSISAWGDFPVHACELFTMRNLQIPVHRRRILNDKAGIGLIGDRRSYPTWAGNTQKGLATIASC